MPKRNPAPAAATAAPALPTVAAYFLSKLGAELENPAEPDQPYSPSHPDFHIETGCGVECRAAIDAAAEILQHLSNAYGEPGNRMHPKGPPLRASVVEATRNIVLCYVYG